MKPTIDLLYAIQEAFKDAEMNEFFVFQLIEAHDNMILTALETAFEDGVGEGMSDPERSLSGKEYLKIKYPNLFNDDLQES
jgi:hypothetical protein